MIISEYFTVHNFVQMLPMRSLKSETKYKRNPVDCASVAPSIPVLAEHFHPLAYIAALPYPALLYFRFSIVVFFTLVVFAVFVTRV